MARREKSVQRRRSAGQVSGENIVVEAAWLYYHDSLNQLEIAQRLNVSRATVVNYLQEARERGLIRIRLSDDVFTGHRLAVALCERFDLSAAYVIPDGPGDDEERFLRVARGAAQWLPGLLAEGDRLGVSWGRTVYEVAEAIESFKVDDVVVSQLVGSMPSPYGFTAEVCTSFLAQKIGARCVNLHAPALLSDADLAARLRQEPLIARQLEALSSCNKVLFAAGDCGPESHIVGSGIASAEILQEYVRAGAAAVLNGRFIDAQGKAVDGPLEQRMIGVEVDALKGREMGILVSDGPEKVEPMRAVIAGGYVTHVVTSARSAEALLTPLR